MSSTGNASTIVCKKRTGETRLSCCPTDGGALPAETALPAAGSWSLIRLRRDSPVQVQYSEPVPGRVLPCRINTCPSTDILTVYQHSWNPSKSCYVKDGHDPVSLLMQDREKIWNAVRSWVQSIPQRNQPVLAGDFNAPLHSHHPHIGPGLSPHKTSAHRVIGTSTLFRPLYSNTDC